MKNKRFFSIVALSLVSAGALAADIALSPIQKGCRAHSQLKSAVIDIKAELPDGWTEESTVAYQLPGKMHITRVMSNPNTGSSTIHLVVSNGQLTVCSQQPNTDKSTRSAYYRRPAPANLLGLGQEKLQLGLTQFLFNLGSGEPIVLAGAGKITANGPSGLAIVTGEKRDELNFDPNTGLLTSVVGKVNNEALAKATVTYRSTNQPVEASLLEFELPSGAQQFNPPKADAP